MVACVEKILRDKKHRDLRGFNVAVFGATGVVGFCAAVIAALEGSAVTLVGYDGVKRVSDSAREIKAPFGVDVAAPDGSPDAKKVEILRSAPGARGAGPAGLRNPSA